MINWAKKPPRANLIGSDGVPRAHAIRLILTMLFLPLFILSAYRRIPAAYEPLEDNGRKYLVLAYNLAQRGIFSLSKEEPLQPTSYREPLYPSLLALGILVTPALKNLPRQGFFLGWNVVHGRARILLAIQVGLLLATAFLAMGITARLTGQTPLALAALYLVGLSPGLQHYIHGYMPELLAALLMTALSALLIAAIRTQSGTRYLAAGIVLGLLTLTRAIFQYFWPVVSVLLLLHFSRDHAERRRMLRRSVAFMLGYFIVVGPWIVRNYGYFGRAYISSRAGVVLNQRAWYDRMDRTTYVASFLYWTPGGKGLLQRLFKRKDYEQLNVATPRSFSKIGRRRRSQLERFYRDPVKADKALFNEAMGWIVRHPVRHLAVTVPLAWKGTFAVPDPPVGLTPHAAAQQAWQVGVFRPTYETVFGPILFASMFWLFVRGIQRRDASQVALVLSAVYSYAAYMLFTDNSGRYAAPSLAIGWISILVLAGRHLLRRPEQPRPALNRS
jgi:4-amino-4-deoxy-L-arabinose transferase-like glycosyltransferase